MLEIISAYRPAVIWVWLLVLFCPTVSYKGTLWLHIFLLIIHSLSFGLYVWTLN